MSDAAVEQVRAEEPGTGARTGAAATALFAAIALAGIGYAKWWPYAHKLATVLRARTYPGTSVLAAAGRPGAAPSWSHAWRFTVAYGKAVWIALAAALLIGAAVETLLPRATVRRALGGPGALRSSAMAGLAAVPCMMCTCCGAPVVRSLRRSGVPVAGALAYWLANPLLNPAVLAFLALVLPWQFTATRLLVGVVLVFAVAPLVARLHAGPRPAALPGVPVAPGAGGHPGGLGAYLRALGRLALWLVPEYFVVVVLVGAFRGWLLPLGHGAAAWGVLAMLIAATAGALLVVPTAGEIPVVVGLVAAGFPPLVTGALLIALPALSLPSMVMVGRALSARVTVATLGAVMGLAMTGGVLLAALGG